MTEAKNLETMKITELWSYAKSIALKGYSEFSKSELIEFLKEYEKYESDVKEDVWNLRFVPEKFKTPEICKIAVEENAFAIRYVPENPKTFEMYKFAVENNAFAINDIPENLKPFEMYKIAFREDEFFLEFVPENFRT